MFRQFYFRIGAFGYCRTLHRHKESSTYAPTSIQECIQRASYYRRASRQDEKSGAVRPLYSPWASPVVLVRKKDGNWWFCIDYRHLNSVTTKDVYPLPRIEDALSCLEGSQYFSIIDLQFGYWQVEVREEDRAKTAFITADGLLEFKVMPFGLSNAPSTFQHMMDVMLAGLKWKCCLIYLDDILVFAKTFDEHLLRLGKSFSVSGRPI